MEEVADIFYTLHIQKHPFYIFIHFLQLPFHLSFFFNQDAFVRLSYYQQTFSIKSLLKQLIISECVHKIY